MTVNKEWLKAAKEGDKASMSALADYYEEAGDVISAAQWRAKAGLSSITYQVFDTITNKVDKEYKTIRACVSFISRFHDYNVRQRKVIKLMEYKCTEVGVVDFNCSKTNRGRWYGRGMEVQIIEGEFTGKLGRLVGQQTNHNVRPFATGYYTPQVMIDGTVHLIQRDHYRAVGSEIED